MGKPHKHAEVLIAIAEGKDAQFKKQGQWIDFDISKNYSPLERPDLEWRIKPEPKPDYVVIGRFTSEYYPREFNIFALPKIKMTFDGETRQPKSAEILK